MHWLCSSIIPHILVGFKNTQWFFIATQTGCVSLVWIWDSLLNSKVFGFSTSFICPFPVQYSSVKLSHLGLWFWVSTQSCLAFLQAVAPHWNSLSVLHVQVIPTLKVSVGAGSEREFGMGKKRVCLIHLVSKVMFVSHVFAHKRWSISTFKINEKD